MILDRFILSSFPQDHRFPNVVIFVYVSETDAAETT